MPVASSLMMQLMLTVDIPGLPPPQRAWYPGAVQGPPPPAPASAERPSPPQSHMAELVAIQVPMPVLVRRVWVGWKPLAERLEALPVRSGGAEFVPFLALRS